MAPRRSRALAVAIGGPALFGMLAVTLAVLPSQPQAAADETTAAEVVAAPASPITPFAVTKADPRVGYRPIPVTHRVRTDARVAFITIDDGVHKDPAALALVEAQQLPITAFISTWTIKDRAGYFTRLTQWGSIQNHSATHASFADDTTNLTHEICYSQKALRKAFGERAWMIRPPYGAGADRFGTIVTSQRCDIDEIVMWDATVNDGRVRYANGRLKPGSILLLHFVPDLERDLKAAVKAIRAAGLEPANLADYLPAVPRSSPGA